MTPWIQDWVNALESGYFKQIPNTKNQWDPHGRHSALGVLCDITGCKQYTVNMDMDRVRTVYESVVTKNGYTGSIDDFLKYATHNKTKYYYGERRGSECLSYIPIDLTAKLKCNACLDLLDGIRERYQMVINLPNAGIIQEVNPNIASLDSAGVPFAAIAEFVRDVWPALTFSNNFEPAVKDYGYFKLERV